MLDSDPIYARPTPGPWSCSDENASDLQAFARHAPIVVYAMDDCDIHPIADCSCNHTCRETEQQVANARLISAAPDMGAALAGLVETFLARPDILRLCGPEEDAQIKAAYNALKKAYVKAAPNVF